MILKNKKGQKYQLQKADIIWVQSHIFFTHPILYIGDGKFIDNQPSRGVNYADFETEIKHRNIISVTRINENKTEQNRIVSNAKKLIGKPYKYRLYNCEHFINEIFEVQEITQLEGIFKLLDTIQ